MIDSGHRIAGRYRLLRVLAQGGMGSIWIAEDTSLGREVAVKVMVPAAFALPELVARFHREAKAAAQIRSAHVVSIFDHGIDDPRVEHVRRATYSCGVQQLCLDAGELLLEEVVFVIGKLFHMLGQKMHEEADRQTAGLQPHIALTIFVDKIILARNAVAPRPAEGYVRPGDALNFQRHMFGNMTKPGPLPLAQAADQAGRLAVGAAMFTQARQRLDQGFDPLVADLR